MDSKKVFHPLLVLLFLLTTTVIISCDEALQVAGPVVTEPTEEPDKPETPEKPTTAGDEKNPEPEEEPADTTPPTIIEVDYYADRELTEQLVAVSAVYPGDTIYTKIVFSEPMQHIIANDETARPALSFVLDEQATRYTVAAHGVSEKDFLSGACTPLRDGTDEYLCKVTIPADTVGTFALQVGAETADRAGNSIAEASVHIASFVIETIEPPKPNPPSTEVTLVEVGSDYTFTLEGETYPGYNPSPEVQHILNTHPSAQLPHFEEAVKMTEVVDWVYRKVWEVYPDDVDKRIATRIEVEAQFGLSQKIEQTLRGMYFDFLGGDPESYYWFYVECFRLLLQHAEQLRLYYPEAKYAELQQYFKESLEKGHIAGQTNPNNYSKAHN